MQIIGRFMWQTRSRSTFYVVTIKRIAFVVITWHKSKINKYIASIKWIFSFTILRFLRRKSKRQVFSYVFTYFPANSTRDGIFFANRIASTFHATARFLYDNDRQTGVVQYIIYSRINNRRKRGEPMLSLLLLNNFNIRVNTRHDISSGNTLIASREVGRIGQKRNIFHFPNDILFLARGCCYADLLCRRVQPLNFFSEIMKLAFSSFREIVGNFHRQVGLDARKYTSDFNSNRYL